MSQKIVVNGKEYASIDQLPAEERRLYEAAMRLLGDRDGDGVPDVLQPGSPTGDVSIATSQTQIVVDGRVYRGAAALPPAARARYEAAMRRLDADGNGIPEVLEGAGPGVSVGRPADPAAGVPPTGGAGRVESTDRRFWLGLVVVALVIVVALALLYGPSLLAR